MFLGGDSKNFLADDHPVIKMERSTWEVRSALSLVLGSLENLTAHKSLVRRVQVKFQNFCWFGKETKQNFESKFKLSI
jgi:hypothetical protein